MSVVSGEDKGEESVAEPKAEPKEAEEGGRERLARGSQMELAPLKEPLLDRDELVMLEHDLRGALSVIITDTSVLRLRTPRRVTEDTIERIERNAHFIERSVRNLIEIICGDEIPPEPRTLCDLGALLADVVAHSTSRADRERIDLEVLTAVSAMIDADSIGRVVANLLQNALKYSGPDSPVFVRLSRHELAARISVIDLGPGIPEHELARVFDKRWRAPAAAGRPGSGIGLFACRHLVERHHGTIAVTSDGITGTTFFFELPLSTP